MSRERARKITNEELRLVQKERDEGASWPYLEEKYCAQFGIARSSLQVLCCTLRKGKRAGDEKFIKYSKRRGQAEYLITRGYSLQEISKRLGISVSYASGILGRLGYDSAVRRRAWRARAIRKEIIEKKKELLNIPQIFI